MGKCYTYQNILTIDGTNIYLTDAGAKKGTGQVFTSAARGIYDVLQYQGPLHISYSGLCYFHHQKQNTSGPPQLPHRTSMSIQQSIILLEFALKILTSSSRVTILNRSKVQPWVPNQPPNCKPVHGRVCSQSSQLCPTSTQALA